MLSASNHNFSNVEINKALTAFNNHSTPFTWHVGKNINHLPIEHPLLRHGLKKIKTEYGMALDLHQLPHIDFKFKKFDIAKVIDSTLLPTWMGIMSACFDIPEFTHSALLDLYQRIYLKQSIFYLGFMDNRAVATARLFLDDNSAGIYHIGTLPEFRGQGIASYMTYTALCDAHAHGHTTAILRSSNEGIRVYQKLGFATYSEFDFFVQ